MSKSTRYEDDTLILSRKNRVTKGVIDLVYMPLEVGSHWQTQCVKHSTCCGHETRKLATYHMSAPWNWCEECWEEVPATRKV